MCGLTAAFSKKPDKRGKHTAGAMAYQLYKKQAARGRQGYGYLAIHDGEIVNNMRALDEEGLKSEIFKETAELVLLHHRFPTSTENTYGTTHPMFVSNEELEYDYYLAHNGVISNCKTLKTKHEELGYSYLTEFRKETIGRYLFSGETEELTTGITVFNDSESLAIEFARWIEGKTSGIGTMGGAAFWCVQVNKETQRVHKIYFGKNHARDLGTSRNKRWFLLGSEVGKQLPNMKLYEWDIYTGKIEEGDLVMDTALPPVTTPYTRPNYGFGAYQGHLNLPSTKESLQPALYNYTQKIKSGHPDASFVGKWDRGSMYYVPIMYTNVGGLVPLDEYMSEESIEVKTPINKKEKDRLDDICSKIARIEVKYELLEKAFYTGEIEEYDYTVRCNQLEGDKALLEDEVAALGVPDETFEETLEISRDLETAFPSVESYA